MLKEYSKDELANMSMLELASLVLKEDKKALDFHKLYDEVAKLKGFKKKTKEDKMGQFYTEINVDGRFMTVGSNIWGLKEWYPVDQHDEQVTSIPEDELEADKELVELGEEETDELEVDEINEETDEVLDEDLDVDDELDEEIDLDEEDDEEI